MGTSAWQGAVQTSEGAGNRLEEPFLVPFDDHSNLANLSRDRMPGLHAIVHLSFMDVRFCLPLLTVNFLAQRLEHARPVIEKFLSLSGTVGLSHGILHQGTIVHTDNFGLETMTKSLQLTRT